MMQYSLIFVSRDTVRLQGTLIPHGNERLGHPVESLYEKRREQHKANGGASYVWSKELDQWQERGFGHKEIDKACTHSKTMVKAQVKAVKALKGSPDQDPWELAQQQQQVAVLRREGYYLAKLEKVAKARVENKEKRCQAPIITHVAWEDSAVEDEPSRIDLSDVLAEARRDPSKVIAWAGADPGVCVTLESVPQSTNELARHLNRLKALEGEYCGTTFGNAVH